MMPPWTRRFLREGNVGSASLANRLESTILGGAVNVQQSPIGYPTFSYQPDGWESELPLMNVSSMVSELAPVVLYLRHLVRPGEVLIIEEPESHLHPALQVEFIRYLAAVVQSGVRVMITTHSEWVIDELANLVRLSELEPDDRYGIGGANYAISPDRVGVWQFKSSHDGEGSNVKEIPYDEEFGGFDADINDVAMDTYNDYAQTSSRIENNREKSG